MWISEEDKQALSSMILIPKMMKSLTLSTPEKNTMRTPTLPTQTMIC